MSNEKKIRDVKSGLEVISPLDVLVSLPFVTADNASGTRTGKQHIYKPLHTQVDWFEYKLYTANISLCGKHSLVDEDGTKLSFEDTQKLNEPKSKNICKICEKAHKAS